MKKVKMIVTPTGEVKVETEGFQGEACMDATKGLKEALGEEGVVYSKDERFETSFGACLIKDREQSDARATWNPLQVGGKQISVQ